VAGDRSKPLVASAALAAALVALSAPLHAQLFGGDDTARKQIAEQTKRIDALAQQMGRVEDTLKSLSSSNPALELSQQLERLRQEMAQMRGQLEVLANDNQAAAKRARDMYIDLDTRLKRFEQPGGAAAAPSGGTSSPPGGASNAVQAPAIQPSEAETRAYDVAQNQRRIGNYPAAVAAFQGFVAQYPKSQLAHRAQYWIGDSQYNMRDFKSAIASQQKLVATWPDSLSVPDALLNIASCQIELGDAAAARKTMDGLVAHFPTSEAAEKARRRLASMK
jgi:tol-pal system protein YbgF